MNLNTHATTKSEIRNSKFETTPDEPIASEDELRDLAEDIVRYCPSLTHLLLALGSKQENGPLDGLN